MKNFFVLFFALVGSFSGIAQEGLSEKNYRVFDTRAGKEVSLEARIESMAQSEVLFYGEEHNDSVTHYLEHKIFSLLYENYVSRVALSMEMFDRDVEPVIDKY